MVDRLESPSVTVPAGTLQAAPLTTALPFQPGHVVELEIIIPPGPSGLMGFQILHSGVPVLPKKASEFVITDDEKIRWPLSNFPTGDKWSVRAFNTDVYNHTIFLRFLVDELAPSPSPGTSVPLPTQPDQVAPTFEEV